MSTVRVSNVIFSNKQLKPYSTSAVMWVVEHPIIAIKNWPQRSRGMTTVVKSTGCWKCGNLLNGDKELFFCGCGVIQPPSREINYFELMDIETNFEVDAKQLHNKFRRLQSFLHPDKFTLKSKQEKEFSEEQSSLVNKAFNTLQKPLSRGLYMLKLHGFSIEGENHMDSEFLMDMMELNESVEDANTLKALKTIVQANAIIMSDIFQQLSAAFEERQFESAKMLLKKAKYYASVDEKIKEKQSIFLT